MIVKLFKIEKHLKISVSLTSNILFTTALTKSPPHSCYLSMVVKYFTLIKRPPSVCSDKCHVINVYKGENEKCSKIPNFEFSWQIGLCQFSRLVVPYLHTKNQKNCRRG